MSYESYAKSEMALVKTPEHIQKQVLALVAIVGDQGHSGGSMGFFGPSLKRWAENPVDITDPADLRYDMSVFLKDFTLDERKEILAITAKVVRFIPLSFLTGEDDEWVNCHGDSYQNRRMSSVFKDGKNGQAYWLYGIIYGHPYSDYSGWATFTRGGGLSATPVVFPYNPETPSQYKYSTDYGFEFPIPESIDAAAWLKWQREIYIYGVDPRTNKVRASAMFYTPEQAEALLTVYAMLVSSVPVIDAATKNDFITRLGYVEESDVPSDDYNFKFEFGGGEHRISSTIMASQLQRLVGITPVGYRGTYKQEGYLDGEILESPEGKRFTVYGDFVQQPSKFYQSWVESPLQFVGVIRELTVTPEFMCVDNGEIITGDTDDYLYQKRREYGYAHPNRKVHRVTAESDSTDPVPEGTEPPKPEYDQNASQGIGDDIGKALK